MARTTISQLEQALAQKDEEIQRLRALVEELRAIAAERSAALRIIRSVIEDVQPR